MEEDSLRFAKPTFWTRNEFRGGAFADRSRHGARRLVELLDTQQQAVQRRGDPREQKRFRNSVCDGRDGGRSIPKALSGSERNTGARIFWKNASSNTHDAGTRFFDNLDSLLQNRDATRADVLAVYLLAVSLGFAASIAAFHRLRRSHTIANQAYVTLFQRSPALPESTPLFPQAYAHTLDGQPPSWLPQLRPWLLSLVGVAVMYLLVAHVIWDRRSTSVSNRLEEILQRKMTVPRPAAGKSTAVPSCRHNRRTENGTANTWFRCEDGSGDKRRYTGRSGTSAP